MCLTQLVHAAAVADFGHHLIASTQEPIEDLGGAKAAVQAEHNLCPTFAAPPQMGFDLQERGFQGRHGGLFPPEQRLVEYLPILARRDPEGFPSGFTPVAPHPGPLTPLGLGPNRHRGEIDIHPQQVLGETMAGRGPIAFQIVPGHACKLGDGVDCARPQGARDGRLVGTARAAKGALHRRVGPNRHVTLGNGLGPTEDPDQGIEDLVDVSEVLVCYALGVYETSEQPPSQPSDRHDHASPALPPLPRDRYRPTWQDPPRQATLSLPRERHATGARFCWITAYAGHSAEVKQQIVDMAMNASGIRDTARVLHVSPTTVIKELKKKSRSCSR